MKSFDKEFWNDKYKNNETGWDIGYVSTPLKEYFDQLKNKELKILIPGGGNSYEAEYLFNLGFENIYLLDISPIAISNFKKRNPKFNDSYLLNTDFFKHNDTYDLIIEQTFFCALNPSLRNEYAKKMHSLLNKNGKLVGLMFNTELNDDKPPFGGCKKEYTEYFEPFFNIKIMTKCYNSIEPREGKELFIKLIKK